ncbi:MAG TPA: hypothetical protein VJG90_00345 [Candidatus Nanoarchaeia archaeon]|nr:hypothetical protein [Candidatus Nanoarchaeia archaeon]
MAASYEYIDLKEKIDKEYLHSIGKFLKLKSSEVKESLDKAKDLTNAVIEEERIPDEIKGAIKNHFEERFR